METSYLCNTPNQLSKTLDDKTENVNENFTNDTKTESEKKNLTDTTKISGIYKIVNKINGKYYVGSSVNCHNRWIQHRHGLRYNKHHNNHLQNAYNYYGEDNFNFIVIEHCSVSDLIEREQLYLDICKKFPDTNYVLSYDAIAPLRGKIWGTNHPQYGVVKSIETRNRISNARRIKTKYHWFNQKLNLNEFCSAYDLRTKYNLSATRISDLIYKLKYRKSHKGWILINQSTSL